MFHELSQTTAYPWRLVARIVNSNSNASPNSCRRRVCLVLLHKGHTGYRLSSPAAAYALELERQSRMRSGF